MSQTPFLTRVSQTVSNRGVTDPVSNKGFTDPVCNRGVTGPVSNTGVPDPFLVLCCQHNSVFQRPEVVLRLYGDLAKLELEKKRKRYINLDLVGNTMTLTNNDNCRT